MSFEIGETVDYTSNSDASARVKIVGQESYHDSYIVTLLEDLGPPKYAPWLCEGDRFLAFSSRLRRRSALVLLAEAAE